MTREIPIVPRTLIVLCRTAGAGKSTFAQQYFESTQAVSSDTRRALICDGDRTQRVDPDIFELFHLLIQKRLKLGCLTVADSMALYDFARRRLPDLAREADYHTCLLVFNVPRVRAQAVSDFQEVKARVVVMRRFNPAFGLRPLQTKHE